MLIFLKIKLALKQWHTFIIFETGESIFLLERVTQGVHFRRFENSEDFIECKRFAACMCKTTKNANINSSAIAAWIKIQQKLKYNIFSNNCLHFAFGFGVYFEFPAHLFRAYTFFVSKAQVYVPKKCQQLELQRLLTE